MRIVRRSLGLAAIAALVATTLGVVPLATASVQDSRVIGVVPMGSDSRLSAAIYDAHGQLVRHLYDLAPRSGVVTLAWDGKDDGGYDLPSGTYSWRAISTGVSGTFDGEVGDLGKPVPGQSFDASENPGNVSAVTYAANGDFLIDSTYEENDGNVRRYTPANLATGLVSTKFHGLGSFRGDAIAVDDNYIYVAAIDQGPQLPVHDDQYKIYRLDGNTADEVGWGGDPTHPQRILITDNWSHGQPVVTGLAVDSKYLWVADADGNQLRVFDKATGQPAPILGGQSSMPLTDPHSIATDGAGHFWIVANGQALSYSYDTTAGNLVPGPVITGLNDPFGLAWDHTDNVLYVSERGTGQVRKFDVSQPNPVEQPTPWHFSNMTQPGPVTDTTFGWSHDTLSEVPGGDAAIAVSPDGKTLSVVDYWNGRTLFFDTTSGASRPERLEGINTPTPDVDVNVGQDLLLSQGRQYQIDYQTPDSAYGHPWQLVNNWTPFDDVSASVSPQPGQISQDSSVIRKLPDGNEYEYVFLRQLCGNLDPTQCTGYGDFPYGGIVIYRLNPDGPGSGLKRVAQISRLSYVGTPINPDITKAPNTEITIGDNPPQTTNYQGYSAGDPSVGVDDQGTIWMANAATIAPGAQSSAQVGVAKLPVHPGGEFDAAGDPNYSLADFAIQNGTQYDFDPYGVSSNYSRQVAYDPVGQRLYAETSTTEFDQWANFGGNAVSTFDVQAGQRLSTVSGYTSEPIDGPRDRTRDSITGLAVDTSGGYYYTGGNSTDGQLITMNTWDGLPVARATSPLPVYSPGLLDRGMSLTAFTHTNGTHYAYAQDDGYGMNTRYAFTGVDSVHRWGSDPSTGSTLGDFDWLGQSSANGLVGWWRFDEARGLNGFVDDSSGGNHWGAIEGDLYNPSSQQQSGARWEPDGVHGGALYFDGTSSAPNSVTLAQNGRDGQPDNVADKAGYAGLSVATWFNTTASGVLVSYQDVWGREDQAKPQTAVPLLYVGTDGKLHGGALTAAGCTTTQITSPGAVNDGTWHHAALAADGSGQTLYLDGNPVGHIDCARAYGNLAFTLLGKGYTTKTDGTTWPATPGGYFHYTGSLDDTRIYNRALSAVDVSDLATPPGPSGPLEHWTFDELAGNMAADVTGDGKDATVTDGTWEPLGGKFGGALAFNGTSTMVTPPTGLTMLTTETISLWVKTTKGGPVLGDQRGPYPTTMVPTCNACGVDTRFSNEAIGISPTDGTVQTYFVNSPLGGPGKSPDLRDDQWHNIVVTSQPLPNPDTTKGGIVYTSTLYVDGVAIDHYPPTDNGSGINSKYRPNSQFGAARDANGNWTYYNGLLDDVQVYDRVLSPAEIQAIAHP